jgi:ABC-type nitrate/sulfonate/bicarbonate transport system substrate-binding protein
MFLGALATLSACAPDATGPSASRTLGSEDAATPAVTPDTIRVGYFSATTAVTVAQRQGFFAAENLVVRELQTPSSPAIFTALRDGHREIILTQIDNVFNYRFNAGNPIGGTFDAVAFMGQDGGNGASLVARRDWLDANPDVAIRFISAFQRAAEFIADPANKPAVMAILVPEAGGNLTVAEKTYQTLVSPTEGMILGGDIDQQRLFGTASLRNSFGGFDDVQNLHQLKTPAGGVYDLTYVQRAHTRKQQASGL